MQTIDEPRLETDLVYRFQFVADFIGFTKDDATALQSAAMFLGPMIPDIVDRTYQKLLDRDCTARHFMPRQAGFDGAVPPNLQSLSAGHPQIQFRKEHLARYLTTVLGRTCDEKLVPYLEMVGKIHTPAAGNHEIDVPLVQMNALMGFLSDILLDTVLTIQVDEKSRREIIRALSKFLWIQNDFITRHYGSSTVVNAQAR
jgi:hypothetical protein